MLPLQIERSLGKVWGYLLPRNMSSSIKAKVNFNSKHLTKGDPLPPYNGKPRLYNMRFCPYAHRAVLAVNAKNIDYEIINIDLVDKPEWLSMKSFFEKVPALELAEGVSISESLVIAEYLDDVYPERPILPKDPMMKAVDKIMIETSATFQRLIVKLVKSPDAITEDVLASYFAALDFIQNQLQQRGTTFLDGEHPGYADYMIWPWFERLESFDDERIKIDALKYKILLEYIKKMWTDPLVKDYMVSKEAYKEYFEAYALGKKPNYDLLLQE